jgi:hypothetical protein
MAKNSTKKDSSINWGFVWFLISVTIALVNVFSIGLNFTQVRNRSKGLHTMAVHEGVESIFKELPDEANAGVCVSNTFDVSLSVYVIDDLGGPNAIYAKEPVAVVFERGQMSVNIVSHEVSHFVDHVVALKQINDTETRAYLQGYFTDCVLDFKWAFKPIVFTDTFIVASTTVEQW